MYMSGWTRGSLFAALKAAGVASISGGVLVLGTGPALADPDPGDPGVVAGPAAGQDPAPSIGIAPFGPPRLFPANGSTVGVGQPIIINFPGLVDDSGAAESAVHVSSVPPVPGKFYWMKPTHQLTVTRNGAVEKTIPMSMGMASGGHQTPNGTYYVQEKMPSVVMDSSTYGVPVNSTYGYKTTVELAVRFDDSGDFVHSAPWSVDDQGKRDVSHGCINISPTNAKWFFDNFNAGDPIVVTNSSGGTYSRHDGSNDWQI
jgi:lipoprotein-anchoring transpeptidase ErfK/SrfK